MENYILPAEDLVLLNNLPADYPRPVKLEWINRGTDQMLRPSTIDLLLRTLYKPRQPSPSVARLHHCAGLRLRFATDEECMRFRATMSRLRGRSSRSAA